MTFSDFIRSRRAGDNPRGDFIRDCRDDPNFPAGISTLSELRTYLMRANACSEAWAEARVLWREYGSEWPEDGDADETDGPAEAAPIAALDTRAKIDAIKERLRAGMSPEEARRELAK
jgi:hypothetical protein